MTDREQSSADRPDNQADCWQQRSFWGMNTAIYAVAYLAAEPSRGIALAAIEELFRRQERSLSRFDPASDLSRLNGCADAACSVSPNLFDALAAALWAAEQTGGLYDPTILADLERAGYDRSFEQIVERAAFRWEASAQQAGAPAVRSGRSADHRLVTLNAAARTVSRPAHVRIDLGGMGKGWAVDRAADLLVAGGPFLINAGGDLYARGRLNNGRGWVVEIEHPLDPSSSFLSVNLDNQALATSTVMKRRWRRNGRTLHHLIDPRTGEPAQTDALSVSVIAQRTVLAEVFAKAALLLGVEKGLEFLERTPSVEGIFFRADGQILLTSGAAAYITEIQAGNTPQLQLA